MSEIHNESDTDSAGLLEESAVVSPDGVSHSRGVEIQASGCLGMRSSACDVLRRQFVRTQPLLDRPRET